jgi:hypothetical protein
MAWILLCFDVLPTFETRKETHAMHHHNTVFHSVLKHVPWHVLDRLVEEFAANKKVRRLTTQNQFIALLYAQLAGSESLRAIEAGFASHASKLYHLGACDVSRSTLSDANGQRPCGVFSGLLAELMGRCERALGRQIADAVYLIDSTGFRLSSLSADWARFSSGVCGAKLHVVYNPDSARPSFAAVTPANVNDITVAKATPIKPGATYVFDLGYYDYGWWAKLDAAGCRIVTRFKVNTPLAAVAENVCRKAPSFSLTASAICPRGKRGRERTRSRTRSANCAYVLRPAKSCASLLTTSMPRPMRSPNSTSAVGRSSCSSAGSSTLSKSGISSEHPRTGFAFRSPSP